MSRNIQAEDLLAFRLVGAVEVAPAGDVAAFVVTRVNREENRTESAIHLTGHGFDAAVPFTGGPSDSSPRFSADGSRLAFLSRRSGQSQVWVMNVRGGEARQLTHVQGGVHEFAWAPDGQRIAFTAMLKQDGLQPEVKEEQEKDLFKKHTKDVKVITELFHKLDGVGHFGERRPCLCTISLAEGAEPMQLTFPPYRAAEPVFTPDGQTILFSSRLGDDYDREAFEQQIYAIPAAGGEARLLTPAGLSSGGAAISPDGSRFAFFGTYTAELGYDNNAIYLAPVAGGAAQRVAAGYDRPFGNLGLSDMPAPGGDLLTWSPDGQRLYSTASIDGTVQLVAVELATGKVEALTLGDRQVYSYSLDAGCRMAYLGIADPLNPGDIYRLELASGAEERVTRINQALLGELELSLPQRFYAQAEGGPRLDGWVMKPAGFTPGQTYPAVLEIHGGPMMMYSAAFFFEFQLLAAQGYGVIYGNPRGSQGYGEEFCKAIRAQWGHHDYDDVMTILEAALAASPWIDPERVGVTGGSYGGFMTNWIVGHTNRFKAAVAGRSISDWRSMVGVGDGGHHWIKRAGGVAPWIDDAWYREQSPISYVEQVRTPILIEHQEGDLRCPLDQGMIWFTAIKLLGQAPVRFVTYPGEFHGMSRNGKPWHRIHRLQEICGWFAQYLG